jgi:aspartyl-tRNA(Asn)/glutamyl-tRNA(Gln) amidotransferase subunit C
MSLTKEEVQHIAKLARLDLTEEEITKFQTELSGIVDYIGTLSEVNTEGVEETAQVTGLVNRLREDEVVQCDEATRQRLLDALPDKQDGYAKVKNVFE